MTPNQLYAREPESRNHWVNTLNGFYYSHVPELSAEHLPAEDPGKRVELRCYKDWCFDDRRTWRLASVWFDGKPFMVIQNAGREGDDHYKRFVTDEETYVATVTYLKTLCPAAVTKVEDVVGPNDEVVGLTEFYGNSLDGHFERYRY